MVNVREVMVETNRMLAHDWTGDGIARWTRWAYRARCSLLDGRQWPTSFFKLRRRRRRCRRRCRCMQMRMVKEVVVIFFLAATADAGLGCVRAPGQLQQPRRRLLDVAVKAHRPMDHALPGRHRFTFSCSQCRDADRSDFHGETFKFSR